MYLSIRVCIYMYAYNRVTSFGKAHVEHMVLSHTVMVTNWCPLSKRRSMSWKSVCSTSNKTLTFLKSPYPSTQPSRVLSRRPPTVVISPHRRISVDPWGTPLSSMPCRRMSVAGSERYKRSAMWWCVTVEPQYCIVETLWGS